MEYLRATDRITMNRDRVLADAKALVLQLARTRDINGHRSGTPSRSAANR